MLRPERGFEREIREERFPPVPCESYMHNFLNSVRSWRPTHINHEVGYKVAVGIDLANKAFRENRAVLFAPDTERIINYRIKKLEIDPNEYRWVSESEESA